MNTGTFRILLVGLCINGMSALCGGTARAASQPRKEHVLYGFVKGITREKVQTAGVVISEVSAWFYDMRNIAGLDPHFCLERGRSLDDSSKGGWLMGDETGKDGLAVFYATCCAALFGKQFNRLSPLMWYAIASLSLEATLKNQYIRNESPGHVLKFMSEKDHTLLHRIQAGLTALSMATSVFRVTSLYRDRNASLSKQDHGVLFTSFVLRYLGMWYALRLVHAKANRVFEELECSDSIQRWGRNMMRSAYNACRSGNKVAYAKVKNSLHAYSAQGDAEQDDIEAVTKGHVADVICSLLPHIEGRDVTHAYVMQAYSARLGLAYTKEETSSFGDAS
jgi:hypothetical protein